MQQLTQFDIKSCVRLHKILVVGPRGSGKTSLIANLVRAFQKEGVKNVYNFYGWVGGFEQTLLHDVVTRRSAKAELGRACTEEKILFVFDDMFEDFVTKNALFERLLTHGKHFNIVTITGTQEFKTLRPHVRMQFQRVFFFPDFNFRRQQLLYRSTTITCENPLTFDEFRTMMQHLQDNAENNTCLTIDISGGDRDRGQFQTFRATKHKTRTPEFQTFRATKHKTRTPDWKNFALVMQKSPIWQELCPEIVHMISQHFYSWKF